ncbi:putative quinol monooxygenase [Mycolicibacterium mengxianglii]|uniref:putative quinol monooxygenase n=1 Tax=Mycolicibacterium mengxianglii TaxID=2736649 RepID=UPI0018D16434|nr:putative quinol monooxygenase [Mycolicibacterium mengxianglii]
MSTAETVVVVAHWQTTEASVDTVLAHLAELQPKSLAEPGCLGYEVFRQIEERASLVLIEHYRDDTALDAHLNSSHYQDLVVGRIRPLLTDRRVEFLRPRDET